MATIVTYTDPFAYRRASTGMESDSLVGNLSRLTSNISAGATSLPVSATTVALNVNDQITIFDGGNSEMVSVTVAAPVNSTTITVTATEAAHVARTPVCSDGTSGSLSDMIVNASSWLETITQQPRWQASYTDKLRAPSTRAAVDRNIALVLRPRRFPVVSLSSLSYETDPTNVISLVTSYAVIDNDGRTVVLPAVVMTNGNQGFQSFMPVGRNSPVWINITYEAGYSPLPGYIIEAANCLTGALLADRQNPMGAFEIQMGKRKVVMGSSRDDTAKGGLVKRAEDLLRNDIERPF
jgi:hypothetical protein